VVEELDAAAREGLERAVAEVHPTSAELLAGDPVPALLDAIRRTKATLVAVGPCGHSRAAGMIVGGVATELLHNAPCSVLFAREPRFGEFPSSVMTGVDGSPESLAALAVAEALAARFHSEHLVVTATGGQRVQLDAIRALVPDVITDPGRPAKALSDLSQEADLLVVGSRGLHGLKALGSVSERVAHRAACSVLVVRNLGGNHDYDH
jgi:nucleotide-binding universal stress UspA family protein